jgi:excisionase family DNA binding protein
MMQDLAARPICANVQKEESPATAGEIVERRQTMRNLTVKEAAERLAVSQATIYSLCRSRKLRHLRLGTRRGTIRIPEDALDALVVGVTVELAEEPASSGDGKDAKGDERQECPPCAAAGR